MITVPNINWQPIANMPEDRKDGREMLLWCGGYVSIAVWSTGEWALCADGDILRDEMSYTSSPHYPPSFWADINPPV